MPVRVPCYFFLSPYASPQMIEQVVEHVMENYMPPTPPVFEHLAEGQPAELRNAANSFVDLIALIVRISRTAVGAVSLEERLMGDRTDQVKKGIDKAADKAKDLAEKGMDKTKDAGKEVGEKVKDAGQRIKDEVKK